MTQQRRHGLPCKIYPIVIQTDNRGNQHKIVADDAVGYDIRVWVFPQRSAKAEVPGQQHINVTRIGTMNDLSGVELWSRVELMGKEWDVVTPPSYRHGTRRHTRHWSIDIRERP